MPRKTKKKSKRNREETPPSEPPPEPPQQNNQLVPQNQNNQVARNVVLGGVGALTLGRLTVNYATELIQNYFRSRLTAEVNRHLAVQATAEIAQYVRQQAEPLIERATQELANRLGMMVETVSSTMRGLFFFGIATTATVAIVQFLGWLNEHNHRRQLEQLVNQIRDNAREQQLIVRDIMQLMQGQQNELNDLRARVLALEQRLNRQEQQPPPAQLPPPPPAQPPQAPPAQAPQPPPQRNERINNALAFLEQLERDLEDID